MSRLPRLVPDAEDTARLHSHRKPVMRQLIDIAMGHQLRRTAAGHHKPMITVLAVSLRIAPENEAGQI